MRILMLGNSFTFYNDMPDMLAKLTGAGVVAHTRGGAMLSEQLNPDTKMGASTLKSLENEKWDYVVLHDTFHHRSCSNGLQDKVSKKRCGFV